MIDQAELKRLVSYDPDTGVFTRLVTTSSRAIAGTVAGTLHHSGYLQMRIDANIYLLHRLAWLYVYGAFPKMVDHINTDRLDNRLANLRECDAFGNTRNRNPNKRSKTGVKGVSWNNSKQKWVVQLQCGEDRYAKRFKSFAEAVRHRSEIGNAAHGEFAREVYCG